MRIIITGAHGQLGTECSTVLSKFHEVMPYGSAELDITNLSQVKTTIRQTLPDILINCAAYTDVDGSETNMETAWNVNVGGPRNLARSTEDYGTTLVHISSDYIFDGATTPPQQYREDDPPRPLSYYGKTKFEGEEAIRALTDRHIIIRTSWLYGIVGRNFLNTILRAALNKPGETIRVVNDQYGSPTWSYRLALQIAQLIELQAAGTYHASSEGYCTWYQLAWLFLELLEVPHAIVPCETKDFPRPAVRPKNSVLENNRLTREGINVMVPWEDDLERYVGTFRETLIAKARAPQ